MRKSVVVLLAIGAAIVMGAPVLGSALAPSEPTVPAHSMRHTEGGVQVNWLDPLFKRTDFYGGQVIPVRVLLVDEDNDPVLNANVTLWANDQPAIGVAMFSSGNTMVNLYGNVYMFLLDTKSYPAGPGSPDLSLTVKAVSPDDHTFEDTILLTLD